MTLRSRPLSLPRASPDLALAALALAVVALLVVPLPAWLLDLALAANLALSATVFLVALFAREMLRLASFPTLLLFTTLLRLALEVSSTRLVLSRGEAGRVIQAFGQVVVAGNYVVGAVVFAILTVVQLLVVTKGAERVAEVAARFTLDALPGKQMSIDADLRAGTIDQAEARRRRRALEREGQLHGAMDGALKFVKGDALAGVAIVLVNVLGGLVAGLVRGLPLEVAARRFALLAIGDGLAAQIPALLVSVAAGVAVTRVAAEEEGGSLADDLARQLLADPRALAAVAALCGGLALAPGLPAAPFLAIALAGAVGAHRLRDRAPREPAAGADAGGGRAPRPSTAGLAPPLVLELAPDVAAAEGGGVGPELLATLRRELAAELGLPLPEIAVRTGALAAGGWRLLLDDVPAAAGTARACEAIALATTAELDAVGIGAEPELEPLTGAPVSRIAAADAPRAAALAPVRRREEHLAASVAAALRAHAHLLVGIQEVQELLDGLEATHPALVREAVRHLPAPVLAEVLRQLLEEGIPVRPLRTILEALLEAGGAGRGVPGAGGGVPEGPQATHRARPRRRRDARGAAARPRRGGDAARGAGRQRGRHRSPRRPGAPRRHRTRARGARHGAAARPAHRAGGASCAPPGGSAAVPPPGRALVRRAPGHASRPSGREGDGRRRVRSWWKMRRDADLRRI